MDAEAATAIRADIEQLDSGGGKRLSSLAAKLDPGLKTLKETATELQAIAQFMIGEGKRIKELENVDPEETQPYSTQERNGFISTALHRINLRIQAARDLIVKLYIIYQELRPEHTNLLAYENSLSLLQASASCPLMAGDYKHKPLTYYTDKATSILNRWTVFQSQLDRSLDQINIRRIESMEKFEKATILPAEFLVIIDEFMLFSHFLIKKK